MKGKTNLWIGFFLILLLAGLAVWLSTRTLLSLNQKRGRSTVQIWVEEASARVFGRSKESQRREILRTVNHLPIEFYGKVVDQNGTPITGLNVETVVLVNNGREETRRKNLTVTDSLGRFQVVNVKGEKLFIHCQDSGYLPLYTNNMFIFSGMVSAQKRHLPNPENPVEFKLRKKVGLDAPLKKIRFEAENLPFNSVLHFNLLSGRRQDGDGDITLLFAAPKQVHGFWFVTIQAPTGGIIEVDSLTWVRTYDAPTNNWLKEVRLNANKNLRGYAKNYNQDFFVHSRNNQLYAKIRISLIIDDGTGSPSFTVDGITTTNYSRSWEGQSPNGPLF